MADSLDLAIDQTLSRVLGYVPHKLEEAGPLGFYAPISFGRLGRTMLYVEIVEENGLEVGVATPEDPLGGPVQPVQPYQRDFVRRTIRGTWGVNVGRFVNSGLRFS